MERYEAQRQLFEEYMKVFLELNQKINLLSSSEERWIWEKHIVDSLALSYFMEQFNYDYCGKQLLDVGTGGGFPALPLAIYYPKLKIVALDSIGKKINAIKQMIERLSLTNISAALDRIEQYEGKGDLVTARAVAPLVRLLPLVASKVAEGGYLIAYKGKKVEEELQTARRLLPKLHMVESVVLTYPLPIDGNYRRSLVVLQKMGG